MKKFYAIMFKNDDLTRCHGKFFEALNSIGEYRFLGDPNSIVVYTEMDQRQIYRELSGIILDDDARVRDNQLFLVMPIDFRGAEGSLPKRVIGWMLDVIDVESSSSESDDTVQDDTLALKEPVETADSPEDVTSHDLCVIEQPSRWDCRTVIAMLAEFEVENGRTTSRIVCSAGLATAMQEHATFVADPLPNETNKPFRIGTVDVNGHPVVVYADPLKPFDGGMISVILEPDPDSVPESITATRCTSHE